MPIDPPRPIPTIWPGQIFVDPFTTKFFDMTKKLDLSGVGSALYGSQWQSDLARALGVTDRQVRRWVAGDTPLPDDLPERLKALGTVRIAALRAIRKTL